MLVILRRIKFSKDQILLAELEAMKDLAQWLKEEEAFL